MKKWSISSLGAMYHAGIKFKKDLQKAKEYYLKATKDENLAKALFKRNEKTYKRKSHKSICMEGGKGVELKCLIK